MRRAPKPLRPYLPNTSDRLSLVSLLDREPFRAHWPIRLTQIVGGKRWSLSLCTYQTAAPVPVQAAPSPVAVLLYAADYLHDLGEDVGGEPIRATTAELILRDLAASLSAPVVSSDGSGQR